VRFVEAGIQGIPMTRVFENIYENPFLQAAGKVGKLVLRWRTERARWKLRGMSDMRSNVIGNRSTAFNWRERLYTARPGVPSEATPAKRMRRK